VIAGRHEVILDLGKNARPIVPDTRRLPVHDLPRPHHLAAERLADGLVAEADAEDRHAAGETRDGSERDARLVRRARPGREDDVGRRQLLDPFHRQLVVAEHAHFGTELFEVLHKVEGKRIVVVDHQHHGTTYLVDSTQLVLRGAPMGPARPKTD
jgi:hypothetical protein